MASAHSAPPTPIYYTLTGSDLVCSLGCIQIFVSLHNFNLPVSWLGLLLSSFGSGVALILPDRVIPGGRKPVATVYLSVTKAKGLLYRLFLV